MTEALIRALVKNYSQSCKKTRIISKHKDLNIDLINNDQMASNSTIPQNSPRNKRPNMYKQIKS